MYWQVCYDIEGKYFDDQKDKTGIIACFSKPFHAEDFIKYCLPKETKNRFYIYNTETGKKYKPELTD